MNSNTPVAQALRGLTPGEEGALELPDQSRQKLRVLKVQRDNESLG